MYKELTQIVERLDNNYKDILDELETAEKIETLENQMKTAKTLIAQKELEDKKKETTLSQAQPKSKGHGR